MKKLILSLPIGLVGSSQLFADSALVDRQATAQLLNQEHLESSGQLRRNA
jgi:hypothetical protein